MQLTPLHSQTLQNTSNESFLDSLIPNEILGIVFDQVVVNQSRSSSDISSILFTCKKWKSILEQNPCIFLVQALFQLKQSPQSAITRFQDCRATDQKKHFTSQELKLIDRGSSNGEKFEKLLMVESELFKLNSLFLSLLDRYSWNPEMCQNSAHKNIQHVAKEQLSILNSLASGSDAQKLMVIKNDSIEKLYRGTQVSQTWKQAKISVISTLKKNFHNFNDKKIFIKVARCFGYAVFDIDGSLKKDRDIVLAAVKENGLALRYANKCLKKDREIVLTAVQQDGWALEYADESFKKNREIVLTAVQQDSRAFHCANETLKKDREIVLAAVKQDGWLLKYSDESLKKDREIVLAAVKQHGWALQYADANLKKDREIVWTAVQKASTAIVDADLTLRIKLALTALLQMTQDYILHGIYKFFGQLIDTSK